MVCYMRQLSFGHSTFAGWCQMVDCFFTFSAWNIICFIDDKPVFVRYFQGNQQQPTPPVKPPPASEPGVFSTASCRQAHGACGQAAKQVSQSSP
jgi:hypothetical protein